MAENTEKSKWKIEGYVYVLNKYFVTSFITMFYKNNCLKLVTRLDKLNGFVLVCELNDLGSSEPEIISSFTDSITPFLMSSNKNES